MSKITRLQKRLIRLSNKEENLKLKIENTITELEYWYNMEDDSSDWDGYEDF